MNTIADGGVGTPPQEKGTSRESFRVLVCGGRDFTDGKLLQTVLDGFLETAGISVLIEGGARGADRMARDWAKMRGIPVQTHDADWKRYGKRAGPIRNAVMLLDGRPDFVVAFPGDKGTANMIEQARTAGIEVIVVNGWKSDASRGSVPSPTPKHEKGVSSPPDLNDLRPEAGAKAG